MNRLCVALVLVLVSLAGAAASAAPASAPTYSVSGTVTGSGVPLAHVKIELRDGKKALGSTTSDAQGHFQLTASPSAGRHVTLHFEQAHFEPMDWTETAEAHKDDLKFALQRIVDSQFLASFPANPNPEGRLRDLGDVLTASSIWSQERAYEIVFPIIGKELADLRTLAQTEGDGERSKDVRERSLQLLAIWGDPTDEPLLQGWQSQNRSFLKDHPNITETTIGQVCDSWAAAHFKQEKAEPPYTYHGCFKPVMDAAGQHALMTFFVRYAHWSYGMYLVVEKDGENWKLARVIDGWIT